MKTYTCNKCRVERPTSEYAKSTKLKRGHTGVCKVCHHAYYENNKTVVIERTRKRRSTSEGKQQEREWQRSRRRAFPLKRMLQEARVRAAKNGLPFDLVENDLSIPDICPVLGIPIIIGGKPRNPNAPSIDRVQCGLGYVRGNVNVISWKANRLKNDATLEELERIVAYYRAALGVAVTFADRRIDKAA